LPAGLTSIGEEAFSGCEKLTAVTIPAGVTSIGTSAFSGCSSLKTFALPAALTAIPSGLFYGTALTAVAIPNGVTSIGGSAFSECKALASVAIPDSVTEVGGKGFHNSTGSFISAGAFSNCENLVTVTVSAHPIEWKWDTDVYGNPVNAFDGCPRLNLASKGALKAAGYTGDF
jgi:hypothetical protein